MTPQEFDAMVGPFLAAQDDNDPEELYQTERDTASDVLNGLRVFLFREEIAREARRKQYLELKAEFEPYL